jgi:hypothetical protein
VIVYGMIHRAARAFAIAEMGEDFWATFAEQHGLTDAAFITAELYPDDTTFGMVAGLSEASGLDQPALLEAFGVYWIDFARQGAYASMMAMGGADLPTFLTNLNRMHDGLAMAMPGARMPGFQLLASAPDHLMLRYVSERTGLDTFVLGLLKGLCGMFGISADVRRAPDDDCNGLVFEIRYLTAAAAVAA